MLTNQHKRPAVSFRSFTNAGSQTVLTRRHKILLADIKTHLDFTMMIIDEIRTDLKEPFLHDQDSAEFITLIRYLGKMGEKLESAVNIISYLDEATRQEERQKDS